MIVLRRERANPARLRDEQGLRWDDMSRTLDAQTVLGYGCMNCHRLFPRGRDDVVRPGQGYICLDTGEALCRDCGTVSPEPYVEDVE